MIVFYVQNPEMNDRIHQDSLGHETNKVWLHDDARFCIKSRTYVIESELVG